MKGNLKRDVLLCVLFGLIGILAVNTAYAGNIIDEIHINLASKHFNARHDYKYNETNLGLGGAKRLDHHWSVIGGFYENSYSRSNDRRYSFYTGLRLKHEQKNWAFGVNLVFATGYDNIERPKTKTFCAKYNSKDPNKIGYDLRCNEYQEPDIVKNKNTIQIIILPTLTWKINKQHAIELGYMPGIGKNPVTFATLQYQYRFGK